MSATDFTKAFEKAFASVPANYDEAFKTMTSYGQKFSEIALEATKKNLEVAEKWNKETLANAEKMIKVQDEASDYAKAATEFATAQAQAAPEHVAAFAEVAKKAQMETVDLMMAAGKDMQNEASKAAKKATKAAA